MKQTSPETLKHIENDLASVDIIMPTYNPDSFLIQQAIQSIMDQTFKHWTLYIAKDGGDTDIQSIVNEFMDERIRLSELSHKGKASALNHAIRMGSAKYIAYLDDDDIWYSNHLKDTIHYMVETGAKFVHTDAYEVYISRIKNNFQEVSRRSLNKGVMTNTTLWYISHINVIHERQLLDNAGLYDESRHFFIDWDMFLRLAKYTRPNHLNIPTCEHFIYLNKKGGESNIISSIHKKDPDMSRKMHYEMFRRAFDCLTPDDFAEIAMDWEKLYKKTDKLQNFSPSGRSKIKSAMRWAYRNFKPGRS
jgi:glycosyltransferase involved in cell wall biosynthesis